MRKTSNPQQAVLNRRQFFRTAGANAASAAAPLILPGRLFRASAPSDRVDFIEAVKARGRTLRRDPVKERFPDDEAANTLLSGPAPRAPWSLETS